MAVQDISEVLTTLFTAPTEAVVKAASEQRRIWINWLKDVQRLLAAVGDGQDDVKKAIIEQHLKLAPVWKMTARVSVGVTMRVASIERKEGSASLGLGVGLLQASGSFGFMSESTSESVMQARAEYALSNNTEVTLEDYLGTLGVSLAKPADLNTAIKRLGSASTPLPEPV